MGKACSVAASNHALLGDTLEQARALAVGSRLAVKHGRRLEAVMALDVLAGVVACVCAKVFDEDAPFFRRSRDAVSEEREEEDDQQADSSVFALPSSFA